MCIRDRCSSVLGRRSRPDPHHVPMPRCTDPGLDRFLPLCSFLAESPYLTCFHCSMPMPRIFISHLQGRILEVRKSQCEQPRSMPGECEMLALLCRSPHQPGDQWLGDLRTSQRSKVLQGWRTKGYPNLAAEVILPAPLHLVQPIGSSARWGSQDGCAAEVLLLEYSCFPNPLSHISQVDLGTTMFPLTLLTAPSQERLPGLVSPLAAFIQSQDQAFSSNSFHSIQFQGQGGCHNCDLNSCLYTTAFHLCSQGACVSQILLCPSFQKAVVLPLASHFQEAGKEPLIQPLHLRLPIVPTP